MQIIFSTSLGIYISDGTPAGTFLVSALSLPNPTGYATVGPFVSVNGAYLFEYQDGIFTD